MYDESLILPHARLISAGHTPNDLAAGVREGQLVRLRRGMYAKPLALTAAEAHARLIAATVPVVHPGNVVSHESAAVLHGLPLPGLPLPFVTMTRRTTGHGDASAVLRVRRTPIDDDEVVLIQTIAVTSLCRTATDLARILPFEWGVSALDAALRAGLSQGQLFRGLERHRRLRGLPKARLAVASADGLAESPAESISRVNMARHAIPPPVLQFEVIGEDGKVVARPDFAWPDLKLVGEVDGRWKYGQLLRPGDSADSAIMREKQREELIREAGYWIVRWDWTVALDGAALARRINAAMERRTLGLG